MLVPALAVAEMLPMPHEVPAAPMSWAEVVGAKAARVPILPRFAPVEPAPASPVSMTDWPKPPPRSAPANVVPLPVRVSEVIWAVVTGAYWTPSWTSVVAPVPVVPWHV